MEEYWKKRAMAPFNGMIIFLTSLLIMMIYAGITKNSPYNAFIAIITILCFVGLIVGVIKYFSGIYKFSEVQPSDEDTRSVRYVYYGMMAILLFAILRVFMVLLFKMSPLLSNILIALGDALIIYGFFRLTISKYYGTKAKTGAGLLCAAYFIAFVSFLLQVVSVVIGNTLLWFSIVQVILMLTGWYLISEDSPEWEEETENDL